MTLIQPYKALALQVTCQSINNCTSKEDTSEKIFEIINIIGKQIKASKAFIGQDLKLVVLPEYFLTGFPIGETIEEWKEKACIAMNGKEYDELKKNAVEANIFLSGNVYELDNNFPDLYYQTSFIIDTAEELILRYRR